MASNALGLDLKEPPNAPVDTKTGGEGNAQPKSPATSPKPDEGKKDPKGKGKERKASEGSDQPPTSTAEKRDGADPAAPTSPGTAQAEEPAKAEDANDKPDLSRPSKPKPYVNPDRVQTGGSQRDKLTDEELAERMARMKMQNEKIKQRRLDVQADEDAFKKTQEAERARLAKARKVQDGVDQARQANAQRKMEKVQMREWDFNKPQRGGRGGGAPQGPSRAAAGAPEGGEAPGGPVSPKLDTTGIASPTSPGSGEATSPRGTFRGAPRGARGGRGGPGRGGGRGGAAGMGGQIATIVVPTESQPSTIGEGPKDTSA